MKLARTLEGKGKEDQLTHQSGLHSHPFPVAISLSLTTQLTSPLLTLPPPLSSANPAPLDVTLQMLRWKEPVKLRAGGVPDRQGPGGEGEAGTLQTDSKPAPS